MFVPAVQKALSWRFVIFIKLFMLAATKPITIAASGFSFLHGSSERPLYHSYVTPEFVILKEQN